MRSIVWFHAWILSFLNGFLIMSIAGRLGRVAIVTKATGESSESSTSLSIVKSVQNVVSPLSPSLSFAIAHFHNPLGSIRIGVDSN